MYQNYLRSLDDLELVTHIRRLSQLSNEEIREELFVAHSTPLRALEVAKSFSSNTTDPFNDDLDSELLRLGENKVEAKAKETSSTTRDAARENTKETSNDNTDDDAAIDGEKMSELALNDDSDGACANRAIFGESFNELEPFNDFGHESAVGDIDRKITSDAGLDGSESEEEVYEVGPRHDFGDFALYHLNKLKKQEKADESYIQWEVERRIRESKPLPKPLFEGCIIHVNGYTMPSINEIHRLVIIHGGKFLSFLGKKSAATHIVCDRLTPRKSMEFKNSRVVKAKWITDCVEKQEKLDWTSYRLISDVALGQNRLQFKSIKPRPDELLEPLQDNIGQISGRQKKKDTELAAALSSPLGYIHRDDRPDMIDILEAYDQDLNEEFDTELGTHEKVTKELDKNAVEDLADSHRREAVDARHPDFLKHFFANSRLHHLSTWKADLRLKFLRRVVQEKIKRPVGSQDLLPSKVILHIDFDCFFAAASCLNYPHIDINKQPVAVSHGKSTSDVASCNYVARSFGVKNGMWVRSAIRKCPNLTLIDYDFDSYEKKSNSLYDYLISKRIFDSIFPVLIDEVLVDASSYCCSKSGIDVSKLDKLCNEIRHDIFFLTKCHISVGASTNVLLAKLSLKKAKPNGYFSEVNEVELLLENTLVKSLPGVGHSLEQKVITELQKRLGRKIERPLIKDLRALSEDVLISQFGDKTGKKLFNYARGIDNTSIDIDPSNKETILGRKSISVEVNYGIRFDDIHQVDTFLKQIASELHLRSVELGLCGSHLSLKLARRSPNAPIDPPKYLGMGVCDFFSKASNLGVPTNDSGTVGVELKALFRMLNIPIKELRGVGVTMSNLEDIESVKKNGQKTLTFNAPKKRAPPKQLDSEKLLGTQDVAPYQKLIHEDIDWDVFSALPYEIRRELTSEMSRRFPNSFKHQDDNVKVEPGSKIFMQQVFPTQSGGLFKYVRNIVSPKKSKKRKNDDRKSVLPSKRPKLEDEEDLISYDSSVVNELPSSIRTEVLKDIEYKKKVRNFNMITLRDKVAKREMDVKPKLTEITPQWLDKQEKFCESPLFLNQSLSVTALKKQLNGWVSMSLKQRGPHSDDVELFVKFLQELLERRNISRALNLIKCLQTAIDYEYSIVNSGVYEKDKTELILDSLEDWSRNINDRLLPLIRDYCKSTNLCINLCINT